MDVLGRVAAFLSVELVVWVEVMDWLYRDRDGSLLRAVWEGWRS